MTLLDLALEHGLDLAGPPATPASTRFARVVEELAAASESWMGRASRPLALPSREVLEGIVQDLRAALFPRHFGPPGLDGAELRLFVATLIDRASAALVEQVIRGLAFACSGSHVHDDLCATCAKQAITAVENVISNLPRVRVLLESDAVAAYVGDPATRLLEEALVCYPGMLAITYHRIAHELYLAQVPLVPRVIAELAHGTTGIDIHPGASIGGSFFIDHGTGVVIGETCRIGHRVRIYQGVTLGARGVSADDEEKLDKGVLRHPVVEDDVVIYAGATLLGRITIGRGATIGGNTWLTRSVPPGQHVTQTQHRQRWFRDGSGL